MTIPTVVIEALSNCSTVTEMKIHAAPVMSQSHQKPVTPCTASRASVKSSAMPVAIALAPSRFGSEREACPAVRVTRPPPPG